MAGRPVEQRAPSRNSSGASLDSLVRSGSVSSLESLQISPPRLSVEDERGQPTPGQQQDDPERYAKRDIPIKAKGEFPEKSEMISTAEPIYSTYDRFGWLATAILNSATVLILGALGFLWFLWMSDHGNKTWHSIAVRNWIIRAATLSSVVLRTSISLQASTATSMLAALALENTQILLLHLASVSTMRNANAGPYMLSWLMFKAFLKDPARWRRALLPLVVLVLVITSFLTQFTSTTLLSDLKPGTVPGLPSSSTTATNFQYDANGTIPLSMRGTVWTKKPPFYPTFAEYHEEPTLSSEEKSDTGLTLRAFLPVSGQDTRSMLRNFSGLATVLDSRVQCVRPQLTLERAHLAYGALLAFTGSVSTFAGQAVNFSCVLPYLSPRADGTTLQQWPIGLSYLGAFPNASFLPVQSEVRPPADGGQYGMAFIVVNNTAGSPQGYKEVLGLDASEFGTFGGSGTPPGYYSNHGEWVDLLFTKNASLVLSVTLCYASYDTAILNVGASSNSNRTEPSPKYDVQSRDFDYSGIRQQLGQGLSAQSTPSPDDRGILALSKRKSWYPAAGDYANSSWLLQAASLTLDGDPSDSVNYLSSTSLSKNITAYMYDATNPTSTWPGQFRLNPDPSVVALFQQILGNKGSVAFAIQALLTTFTGIAYYDQLQQFNNPSQVTTTSFILVSRPDSIRGLVAVTVVASVHLLLIAIVLYRFIFTSSISTIGNAWQTVAQVVQGDAARLVSVGVLATDDKVEEMVKNERWKRRLVGLKLSEDRTKTELAYRDSPGGLAKMMKNAQHRRHILRRRRVNQRALESRGDGEVD